MFDAVISNKSSDFSAFLVILGLYSVSSTFLLSCPLPTSTRFLRLHEDTVREGVSGMYVMIFLLQCHPWNGTFPDLFWSLAPIPLGSGEVFKLSNCPLVLFLLVSNAGLPQVTQLWPSCCLTSSLMYTRSFALWYKSITSPGCPKPSVVSTLILCRKISFYTIPYSTRLHIKSFIQVFSVLDPKFVEASYDLAVPPLSHKCPIQKG